MIAAGDLVEIVDSPPRGMMVWPASLIGARGVVVSGEYVKLHMPVHDVLIGAATLDVATVLLRKIAGPPADSMDLERESTYEHS